MKKNIIKIICFLGILVLLLIRFYQVFQYRFDDEDGIEGMQHFYRLEENSVDVICFGSSHMFVDVNTATLWDEYGIAAYDLGGTIQPFWNTYYFMKESLKTQSPKLLVVDCYGATLPADYAEESGIIKNTFGMKPSKDKWDAIKASAPDKHLEYFLGYPGFHGRYTVLNEQDFLYDKGIVDYDTWKGHHTLTETNDFMATLKPEHIKEVTEISPLREKNEQYLNMIIDLAQERNIPLLLIATPYCIPDYEEKMLNRVAEIADERGVPFINYNYQYDEIGLDFASDYADTHHLNYKGSPKFTRVLAKDMKTMVDLADHRGEAEYADYDTMAYLSRQTNQDAKLKDTTDFSEYIDMLTFSLSENSLIDSDAYESAEDMDYLLKNNYLGKSLADYTVAVSYRGVSADSVYYNKLNNLLTASGTIDLQLQDNQFYALQISSTKWTESGISESPYMMQGPDTTTWNFDIIGNDEWHKDLSQYDNLTLRKNAARNGESDTTNSSIQMIFNKNVYETDAQGIQIFVYNNSNNQMVEAVFFPWNDATQGLNFKTEIIPEEY